jgi:dihydroneopterin aldolase
LDLKVIYDIIIGLNMANPVEHNETQKTADFATHLAAFQNEFASNPPKTPEELAKLLKKHSLSEADVSNASKKATPADPHQKGSHAESPKTDPHKKDTHQASGSDHSGDTHAGGHEAQHGPKRWYQKVWDKIPHPSSADFGAHPLLEKLTWGLTGAVAIAWLHSSILTPALTLGLVTTYVTKKYVLPALGIEAGGGHGGGHGSGH